MWALALTLAVSLAAAPRGIPGRTLTPGYNLVADPAVNENHAVQLTVRSRAEGPAAAHPLLGGALDLAVDANVIAGLWLALGWRAGFKQDTASGASSATFGDMRIAAGYSHALGPIDLGAALELHAPNLFRGEPGRWGLSPALRLMGAVTLARLRLGLNVRGELDRSDALLVVPTARDRVAFGVGSGNVISTSVVAALRFEHLEPFVELEGRVNALSRAACPPLVCDSQVVLAPGLRWTPVGWLRLEAAGTIALYDRSVTSTPLSAWTASLTAAMALGNSSSEVRVVERVVDAPATPLPPPATTGSIRGRVVESTPDRGLSDVVVERVGGGGRRVLSDVGSGVFNLIEVPPGQVRVRASLAGFEPGEAVTEVVSGQTSEVTIALRRKPAPPRAPARLRGVVMGTDDKPIKARLAINSGSKEEQSLEVEGEYDVEIPPGEHQVTASAEGYAMQGRTINVLSGETVIYDVGLKKSAAPRLIDVKPNAISLKKTTILFAAGRAVILPNSFAILDEVANALLSDPEIRQLRIEGHTDEIGDEAFNQSLSERRCYAVREALIERGVSPDRLAAQGLGKSRPISSNKSLAGRAKNRRVEFVLVR